MCRYRHDCDPNTGVPLPAPNRSKKRYRQSRRREQVQEAYVQEAYVQDKEQDDERYTAIDARSMIFRAKYVRPSHERTESNSCLCTLRVCAELIQ